MPKSVEAQTYNIRQIRDALKATGELIETARKERGWSQSELGKRLEEHLDAALNHGISVGGARPKSLLQKNREFWIAKFSASRDPADMLGIEGGGMALLGLDEHARNHACFWDDECLSLTPAYNVCPQPRTGISADQAMIVGARGRQSNLQNAMSQCDRFGLGFNKPYDSYPDNQRSAPAPASSAFVCGQ